MIICRSKSNELRVSLPANVFGVGQDAFGNPAAHKSIKFRGGEFRTSDPFLIECLKKHTGNMDVVDVEGKRGKDFWIETPDAAKEVLNLYGEMQITAQDLNLRASDVEKIKYLEKCYTKLPNSRADLADAISGIVDRFGITCIKVPSMKDSDRKFVSRIGDILDLLEDQGIWPNTSVEVEDPINLDDALSLDSEEDSQDKGKVDAGQRTDKKGKALS